MTLLLKHTSKLLALTTALYTETKHMGLCRLPTVNTLCLLKCSLSAVQPLHLGCALRPQVGQLNTSEASIAAFLSYACWWTTCNLVGYWSSLNVIVQGTWAYWRQLYGPWTIQALLRSRWCLISLEIPAIHPVMAQWISTYCWECKIATESWDSLGFNQDFRTFSCSNSKSRLDTPAALFHIIQNYTRLISPCKKELEQDTLTRGLPHL